MNSVHCQPCSLNGEPTPATHEYWLATSREPAGTNEPIDLCEKCAVVFQRFAGRVVRR